MLPTDAEATNQDLQDTGLTDPMQQPQQQAVLADVGENILLIPEPIPSDQIPAAPPPPPGQQTVTVSVHQEKQQTGDIPEPLAAELTSIFSF